MFSLRHFLTAGAVLLGGACTAWADDEPHGRLNHVLLISVDGLHEVDLRLWVQSHPNGALATLAKRGAVYSRAYTTTPSDSFPGILAQVTGGTPFSTGVFYDDSFDRSFYPPRATGSTCNGAPGAETTFAENIDKSLADATAGGTLGDPLSQIDPAQLPQALVDGKCVSVLPHQFLRVNTIFEVLRAHNLRTAWADKHPAYEILNGPSGKGIEDLYTPEINSQIPGYSDGKDNTKSYAATRNYDKTKVDAVLNEIEGLNSTGKSNPGVPAIFGMNFQAVSVGQKLPASKYKEDAGLSGGYLDAAGTPGTALTAQLQFVDEQIGRMIDKAKSRRIFDRLTFIVSAKHGQSPIDRSLAKAVPDNYADVLKNDGYGFNMADDASLIWLNPAQRTPATLQATLNDLKANADALGIKTIYDRDELKKLFRDPASDNRTPDFFVVSKEGVIYTSSLSKKIAEHGGVAEDDRHVALLVSAPGLDGRAVHASVSTTQIAPTILKIFGIRESELQAVQIEHTRALPGLFD